MKDLMKLIKIEMINHDVGSITELSKRIGWNTASFYSRVRNNTMRLTDLEKIANAMDCSLDIKFVDRK